MRKMLVLTLLGWIGFTGCNLPIGAVQIPPPTQTALIFPTLTPTPPLPDTATPSPTPVTPTVTVTPVAGVPSDSTFCTAPQVTALLQTLKNAILTSDGPLFASLVSPIHGMDARYWRYGRVVNYDQRHARWLFVSTYRVNWGPAAGSGLPTRGAFHDVLIPPLREVFNSASTINVCNQIKTGGATYIPEWPYYGVNFYSIHFPGTDQYGGLDWRTWLVGIEYVRGKPYLYALIHLNWEP